MTSLGTLKNGSTDRMHPAVCQGSLPRQYNLELIRSWSCALGLWRTLTVGDNQHSNGDPEEQAAQRCHTAAAAAAAAAAAVAAAAAAATAATAAAAAVPSNAIPLPSAASFYSTAVAFSRVPWEH